MHRRNREREENIKLECGICALCIGANILSNLTPAETTWEEDEEVMKRSGSDEPMWV
jgi:hypothetical protein